MNKFVSDIKELILRFQDDDVPAMASMLTYSLIVSFFPFIIFLMTLAGYSSLRAEDVLSGMRAMLPEEAYELVSKTVSEVLGRKNVHLLSISLLFTIFAASNGFTAVIKGLNKAYDEEEKRSFIKIQFISVCCTLGITVVIIISVLLLVFGQLLSNSIASRWNFSFIYSFLWTISRYIIILFSMITVFAFLYKYTPSRKLNMREVMPGTMFASAGWLIVSLGFAFYINNFQNYSIIYGSIGAVFILLNWLFFTSIVIMLGGEINATLAFDKEGKKKPKGKDY